MFSLIRCIIVIALIFYFSPARDPQQPERQPSVGQRTLLSRGSSLASEARNSEDGLWERIVGSFAKEAVRSAVNDKVQSAGLSLKDEAPWPQPELSGRPASATPSRPTDRNPAERDSQSKSARCIYRCDAAE